MKKYICIKKIIKNILNIFKVYFENYKKEKKINPQKEL